MGLKGDSGRRMFAAVAAVAFVMCAFSAFVVIDDSQDVDAVAWPASFDVDLGTVTAAIGETVTVDLDEKFTEVYENPRTNWGTSGSATYREMTYNDMPAWTKFTTEPDSFKDSDLSGLNAKLEIKADSTAQTGTYTFAPEYTLRYGNNMVHATFECTIHIVVDSGTEDGDRAVISFNSDSSGTDHKDVELRVGNQIQLPTQLFTKDGYYLAAWADAVTGSTLAPGQTITVNSDMELTAQWAQGNGTYKGEIIVNPGESVRIRAADYIDGTGSITVSESCDWLSGGTVLTGKAYEPGVWMIQFTQSLMGYSPTYSWISVVVPSTMDNVYQISFDMNGGTGSVGSRTVMHGTGIVLPGADVTSWPGGAKHFVGWEITDASGNKGTFPAESLYVFDSQCTVKAVWESNPNVIVYVMDGGALEGVYADITYTDEAVTLRDDAVKDGYEFIGWMDYYDRELVYMPGFTTTFDGPVYLLAYFVPEGSEIPTVTFDAGQGSILPASQRVESGKYVVLPDNYMVQAPSGYVFKGWSTQAPSGSDIADDRDIITTEHYLVTSSVTLYAVYAEQGSGGPGEPPIEDAEFSVTFRTMGGDGSYPQQIVKNGDKAIEPDDPTKDGCFFLGWAKQGTTDVWDFDTPITGNTILYAMWDDCFSIQYSMTDVEGGQLPTITITVQDPYASYGSVQVYWGEVGSKVENVVNGTASHTYTYTSYGYIVLTLTQSGEQSVVRMPFSVQADHYNPSSTRTVTFNSMGGSTVQSQTVEVNGYVQKPADPTKNGFNFLYWADLYGNEFDFSTQITVDITLYAMWTDAPVDVEEDELVAFFTMTTTNYGWLLDGSGSQNAVKWIWMMDDVKIGEGQSYRIEVDDFEPGTHVVQLIVEDADGNQATSDPQKLNIGDSPDVDPVEPVASFTFKQGDGTIVFDASKSENVYRYQWVVDGVTVGNVGPKFEFSTDGLQPGTHTVILYVYSVTEDSDRADDTFVIEAPEPDPDDGTDWVLIAAIVIVVIVIVIIVARFVL